SVVDQLRRVGNQRAKALRKREILIGKTGGIEKHAVSRPTHGVLFCDYALEFLTKSRGIEHVTDANSMPRHLVLVSGSNATRGRADFPRATRRLGRFFHLPVIRENQVRAVG